MKKDYFCGWYFKCQSGAESVALIPAAHTSGGVRSGSLQVITRSGSWSVPFAGERCTVRPDRPWARLGENMFSPGGIRLDLRTPDFSAEGNLRFGGPTPLRYDIMGPFCALPGMECRHRVYSMGHRVDGLLRIDGRDYLFDGGAGYVEGDRGRSFPRRYLWTQCSFGGGSLMLSAAEIPLGPIRFTGIIGAVVLGGREYRLATYLGARALKLGNGELVVRQGELTLAAALLEPPGRPLQAPVGGAMTRTIREHVACRARYRLQRGGRILLDLETERASFEYEYE